MLSLATSIVTIIGFHLVAKKRWEGCAVGLANQALWLALILQTRTWGLLLLNVTLVWIYGRALIDWRHTHNLEASTETPEGGSIEPLVAVPLYDLCDLYELALTRFGLTAERCVFFDDTAKNIVGANEVGIHGILFENALQARESLAELGVRL